MTRGSAGAVCLVITPDTDIESAALAAGGRVAPGRALFALWQPPQSWAPTPPVESMFLRATLSSPPTRPSGEWTFVANGAVRLYGTPPVRPVATLMWCAVRRTGAVAYERLRNGTVSDDVRHRSEIPVAHPVFTRDVANNVWHLPARGGERQVLARLRALTTWSDEEFLILKDGRWRRAPSAPLDLGMDLIGSASRVDYRPVMGCPWPPHGDWAMEPLPFEVPQPPLERAASRVTVPRAAG